jgi:hypothetical protein
MTTDYGAIALGKDAAPSPSVSLSEEASSESYFLTKEYDESSSLASWSPSFFKNNKKVAVLVAVIVIMVCAAMVQLTGSKKQSTIPSSSSLPLLGRVALPGTWPPPPIKIGFLLTGGISYESLHVDPMNRLQSFKKICLPKCWDDPKCTGVDIYSSDCHFFRGDVILSEQVNYSSLGKPMAYAKSSVWRKLPSTPSC